MKKQPRRLQHCLAPKKPRSPLSVQGGVRESRDGGRWHGGAERQGGAPLRRVRARPPKTARHLQGEVPRPLLCRFTIRSTVLCRPTTHRLTK